MVLRAAGDSFRNLTIRRKLFAIVVFATISTTILLYLALARQSDEIGKAEREKAGLEYILPVQTLLRTVQQHRDTASGFLNGDNSFKPLVDKSAADADAALAAVLAADKKAGARFHTGGQVAALKQAWQELAAKTPAMAPAASDSAHTQLIRTAIVPLISSVGNASGLLLDPQTVSSHMAAALVNNIPATTEALSGSRSQVTALVAASLKAGGAPALTPADRALLVRAQGVAIVSAELGNRELQAAIDADPAIKGTINGLIQAATESTLRFNADARSNLLSGTTIHTDAFTVYNEATSAIDSIFQLNTTASNILHRVLAGRVNAAIGSRDLVFGVAIGGVAFTSLLILLVVVSLTRRIARLVAVADRISLGELDAAVATEDGDELGELARSLARMQASLQAAIERLRTRRAS